MNFSRFNSKNDTKLNAGHATVTVPSTPDRNKGPAQADQKGNDAKPTLQTPGNSDTGNQAKSDGHDRDPSAKLDAEATVKASGDKADNEAMVSEGGHASPGKTPGAVREPDAATPAKTEPLTGPTDGKTDGLSAKSVS
jgi:hypothetical protein